MRGLGGGLHILDWLAQITFPHEARFSDVEYARRVYASCISGSLKQGITTACYYASLHGPATKVLVDVCLESGQREFVGMIGEAGFLVPGQGGRPGAEEEENGAGWADLSGGIAAIHKGVKPV